MTMTGTEIDAVEPISGPDEAARIGVEAYEVLVSDLERLGPDEWRQVTVCAPWTVADTVRHLLGAAEATRSTYEMARQLLRGARNRGAFAGNTLDAVNDLQVRRHRHLDPDEALDRLRAVYPESVAVRTHGRGSTTTSPSPSTRAGRPLRGCRGASTWDGCSGWSTPATSGCTASTSPERSVAHPPSMPRSTAASSPTSSGSGRTVTPNRSIFV